MALTNTRLRPGNERRFFTDQSGVIRSTREERRANVQDPPLPGEGKGCENATSLQGVNGA
jgi:hypothetical protein